MGEREIKDEQQKTPKITVEIVFARHATAQDLGTFSDQFQQADIYIMEAAAWTPEFYNFVNDLSRGKKMPSDIHQLGSLYEPSAGHVMAELDMIHGSGKPVGFIDIQHGKNEAMDLYMDTLERGNELLQIIGPDFSETLARLRKSIEDFIQLDKDRESHMVEAFPRVIQQILEDHPRLKKRESLSVITKLGSAHLPIVHALNNEGYETKSTIYEQHSYSWTEPSDEALLKMRQEGFVSDGLLARAVASIFIGNIFRNNIESLSSNYEKKQALLGRLTASFTYNEIRNIYPYTWQATSVEELKTLFLNLFASHEIGFPADEDELDALITPDGESQVNASV